MKNFRLYGNASSSRNEFEYLLDVQSELLCDLKTRLVIPLVKKSTINAGIKILNPEVRIADIDYIILTQQMAAVPLATLGKELHDFEADRTEILSSIDFLITGF